MLTDGIGQVTITNGVLRIELLKVVRMEKL